MKLNEIEDRDIPTHWDTHRVGCLRCQKYDSQHSATLVNVCVIGAPILKRLLEIQSRPEIAAKRKAEREQFKQMFPNRISAQRVRAEMRYKGE